MSWQIYEPTPRSYHILDSQPRLTTTDWDEATLLVAARYGTPFARGQNHPEFHGLYCVLIQPEKPWHGVPVYRCEFSGVDGGGSKELYDLSYDYSFSERELLAKDYADNLPKVNGNPKWKTPAGDADVVRLTNLNQTVTKRWITNRPPPPSFAGLNALAPDWTAIQPVNLLNWLAQSVVYQEPNGMVARAGRWQKHPLPQVALWMAEGTWEYVPSRVGA